MYKILAAFLLIASQCNADCVKCDAKENSAQSQFIENDHKKNGLKHLRYIDDLFASGSEQFSENQLALIIKDIIARGIHPSKILIVDLREEAHFFANGVPFTVTDVHENPSEAFLFPNEERIQKGLMAEAEVRLDPRKLDIDHYSNWKKSMKKHLKPKRALNKPLMLKKPMIEREVQLCNRYGVQYWRMPLTDHYPPDKAAIEIFVKMVRDLPKGTWLHIHCRGGEGRTTTFLSILEMLRMPHHSLYDILTKQHKIGGKDLLQVPEEENRKKAAIDRLDVIRDVYEGFRK
ncbi:MAG: hypothetical protein Q8S21_02955 [Candidatus Paracaedibacteraceae bacterium]|nr:hypothetical protein [Candidatus Paracaedibacteraceae bacterium]